MVSLFKGKLWFLYNQTINKTLLVYKGPEIFDYTNLSNNGGEDNSIGIILRSSCQYSYGTSNVPDIADTASKIGVSYTAGCTDLSLIQPGESWVLNKNTEVIQHHLIQSII